MKNTFTRSFTTVLCALFTVLFFGATQQAVAQPSSTITFTLVKQPCNNDGILVANTTGLPLPITLNWRYGNQSVTHIATTASDTLYNYNGASVYVFTGAAPQAYGQYAGSPPFTFTDTVTGAVCPALGNARATATGGTAPYTYEWIGATGAVVATGSPVGLPPGNYGLQITDALGCVSGTYGYGTLGGTGSSNFYGIIVENLTPIKDSIVTTTAGCTNGTASVVNVSGGTAPYTYLWSNGANTATVTGLMAGTLQVTVTDAQGCFRNNYVSVRQSITINVTSTVSNATCLQNDGSIIAFGAGGASPYSYSWNNGQQTQIATGLVAGSYNVTVTDANNCTALHYKSVTGTTPITVTYTTTASSCTAATGSATLNISGGKPPYSISWGTFPAQNSATATGLPAGAYNFVVKDSVGCVRTGVVSVPPVSQVAASIVKNDATCTQSNGNASVIIGNGVPPYTYLWASGSTATSISGLKAGSYPVTITDKLNCTLTKTALIKAASPVKLTLLPTSASCIFTADGSITANVSGGTTPYTFNWSNGQTTAVAAGLLTGYHSVYVQDAAGCVQSEWTTLGYNAGNNSCYCTISGRVYVDTNTNCTFEAGEKGVQNIMVHASGLGYAFTNSNGIYSFKAPTGNYTVSETVQAYYPLAPCQNNAVPVSVTAASGCLVTQDFANSVNPIHDVKISTISYNSPPVIGYEYFQRVVVENNGTVTEPAIQMGYEHDGQLVLGSVTPSLFSLQDSLSNPNWYGITNTFPTLAPAGKQVFDLFYHVPANIPMNTEVVFHDTVAYAAPIVMNWLTDYSPGNNVNTHNVFTVGSFDPNMKEVSPLGEGVDGFITNADSVLTYSLHFQNTGNYPARKVVVIDTLDNDLDFTTLQPGYGSHSYVADMSENGIVKFTFDNINLPDSVSQPLASMGVVLYTVKQKPNLAGGTRLTSPASIYFDFNAPVQTNTVLNTIDIATGIRQPKVQPFEFNLYPNPSNGLVNLAIHSEISAKSTLNFYNMLGEVMQSQTFQMEKGANSVQANTTTLVPGIYFAVVTDGHYSYTRKVTILE